MTKEEFKNYFKYASKRYIGYFFITCIALILPFIQINGNQFFLISFERNQIHLLFAKFDVQELYLMPFVIIIFFIFIFFITNLGGRVWCGWSCPQTIFRVIYRDLIQTKILKINKNITNKQILAVGMFGKKSIALILWMIFACIAAANFLWIFVPPMDFFAYIQNPADHTLLITIWFVVTAFLIFDVAFLAEKFCVYVCPYARIQSTMIDTDTIQVIYDESRGGKIYDGHIKLWKKPPNEQDQCTGCEACVKICPTHIDIRKGMQLDCINCLECVDACTKTMSSLNLPSLISWTSSNSLKTKQKVRYIRFKTIGYVVIISIAATALTFMSMKKEYMLLNINRTSELYKIKDDKSIQNAYTFLFQNTDSVSHSYYFDVNDTNIKIERPKDSVDIEPGQKKKVVVVLQAPNVNSTPKDVNTKITINAYAKDKKEQINIKRETIFVYPKKSMD
ncbi:MAG: cytochrome c oxidase accessory protein CcoG [Campylobacter sp.]